MLHTSPDSPPSKPFIYSNHDTLLLKSLQWLPITYRMKDRLSLTFRLCHLAFIVSSQLELLSIAPTCPVLSCFYAFTKLFLLPKSPFPAPPPPPIP